MTLREAREALELAWMNSANKVFAAARDLERAARAESHISNCQCTEAYTDSRCRAWRENGGGDGE